MRLNPRLNPRHFPITDRLFNFIHVQFSSDSLAMMGPLVFERAEQNSSAPAIDISQIPDSVLAQIGVISPPPGVTPNFVNPTSLRPLIITFSAFAMFIITICAMIRLWAILKLLYPIRWGWSDTLFVLAYLSTLATLINQIVGTTSISIYPYITIYYPN